MNNKVANLIHDAMVKKFKFGMRTDLISDAPRSTGRLHSLIVAFISLLP